MIKSIEVKCGRCGKTIRAEYDHDPENPVPVEWLDKLSKCLACDECLVDERRMTLKEYREGAQPVLPRVAVPHHEPRTSEPRTIGKVGLPYKDE